MTERQKFDLITMTAPVVQEEKEGNTGTVSFVMPAGMTLSDLPAS